jgi:hypothetical protein
MVMESPAGSYARSRQLTTLPTVRFSPATTVSFTAAANRLRAFFRLGRRPARTAGGDVAALDQTHRSGLETL